MALEIERRFLIKNNSWKEFITEKIFIEQGYLSKSLDNWIIRIRFTGKDFKIAFKKHIKIHRCIAVADGFYEWKRDGKEKTPF